MTIFVSGWVLSLTLAIFSTLSLPTVESPGPSPSSAESSPVRPAARSSINWQAPQSYLPAETHLLIQTDHVGSVMAGAARTWLSFMPTALFDRSADYSARPLEPYSIHGLYRPSTSAPKPEEHHWLLTLKKSFKPLSSSPEDRLAEAIDQLIPEDARENCGDDIDAVIDLLAGRFDGPGFLAATGPIESPLYCFGFGYDREVFDWQAQLEACREAQDGDTREVGNVVLFTLPLDGCSFYAERNAIYGISSTNLDRLQELFERQHAAQQQPLEDSLSQQRSFQRAIATGREREFSGQVNFFATKLSFPFVEKFWSDIPVVCGELQFDADQQQIDYVSEWLITQPFSTGVVAMQEQLEWLDQTEEIYLPTGIAYLELLQPTRARLAPPTFGIWFPAYWTEDANVEFASYGWGGLANDFDELLVGQFLSETQLTAGENPTSISLEGLVFPTAKLEQVHQALRQSIKKDPERFFKIEEYFFQQFSRYNPWMTEPQLIPTNTLPEIEADIDSPAAGTDAPTEAERTDYPTELKEFDRFTIQDTQVFVLGVEQPGILLLEFQDTVYLLPNIVAGLSKNPQKQIFASLLSTDNEFKFWQPITLQPRKSILTGVLKNVPLAAVEQLEPVLTHCEVSLAAGFPLVPHSERSEQTVPAWVDSKRSPLFVLSGFAATVLCGLQNWEGTETTTGTDLLHQRDLIQTAPYFRFHDTIWQPEKPAPASDRE